ncbi:MAG: hypothetical protein ACE3JP_04840 [Ectobacillus sp.]
MLRKVTGITAVLLLAIQFGCSSNTVNEINKIKDDVQQTVQDVKETVGNNVAALDQVNTKLAEAAGSTIKLLQELKWDLSFEENGIAFTNNKELSGTLGIDGNTLFLDIYSTSKDAKTIQTIARLATVFSSENTVEDRLHAAVNKTEPQYVQLSNGYIKTDGQTVTIHLESYL